MKFIIKLVAIVVVLATVVTAGVSIAGNISSPKKTLQKFEEAYNNVDFDGMVECFDPRTQSLYSGADALMDNFLGIGIGDLGNIAYLFSGFADEEDIAAQPIIDIEVNDWGKTDKENAWVECTMSVTAGDVYEEEDVEFQMVKIDGEWYINASDEIMDSFSDMF